MTRFSNISRRQLNAGDSLPELAIPITAKLVAAGAIATQDFQDVHHDKAAAMEKGTPDIFMNILTTNGLVGRYLTDWAGPGARIRKLQFKLGAPNYPGDTMVLTGQIAELQQQDDQDLAVIQFRGKNGMGNHVSGTAVVQLATQESTA